LNQKYMV